MTNSNTSVHQYKSDITPERIEMQWDKTGVAPTDFKNPFDDVKIPDFRRKEKKDAVDSILSEMSGSEAKSHLSNNENALNDFGGDSLSAESSGQDESFDYENTNAERYVNSPCYISLGFNPKSNSYEREKRYSECEENLNEKRGVKYFMILLILFGLGSLIYLGIRTK